MVVNQLVSCPHCSSLTFVSTPAPPEKDELFLGFHVRSSNPACCRCCGERFTVYVDWRGRVSLSRHP